MARRKYKTPEEKVHEELARDSKGELFNSEKASPLEHPTPSFTETLNSVIERLELAYRISRDRKVNEILFNQIDELKKLL